MFVRQMIGRHAGEIVEMRADAAQACLSQGSAAAVTDEEMTAAGLALPALPAPDTVPVLPAGYEFHPRQDSLGFDVFRSPVERGEGNAIISEPLNVAPLHNLAALRDYVAALVAAKHDGANAAMKAQAEDALIARALAERGVPENWRRMSAADLKALAVSLGVDPAPGTKDEAWTAVAAIVEAVSNAAVAGAGATALADAVG